MEHYLMWKLQKYPPSMNEPSIWPPRSYPCTFCRREFRSAQALGGHMNVHRRDRARLKHSPPPPARIQESGGPENLPARSISTTPPNADEDDFAETNVVCKRHKRCSSMEEIDLELRLGAPAVKVGQFY